MIERLNHLIENYSPQMLPSLGRVELWHLFTLGYISPEELNKYIKGKRQ